MAHGSKAAEIREAIAERLASGESVEHSVCGTKCTARTVYRWLHEDISFVLLVEEIRVEALEETRALRIAAARRAARRLLRLLGSADEKIALKAVGIALEGLGEVGAVTMNKRYALDRQIGQCEEADEAQPAARESRNGQAPPKGEKPI
jgi:hypothetical protein